MTIHAKLGAAAPSIMPDEHDEDLADLDTAIAALQRMRDRRAGGRQSARPVNSIKRLSDTQPLKVIATAIGWSDRRTSRLLLKNGLGEKRGTARCARVEGSLSAVANHLKLSPHDLAERVSASAKSTKTDEQTS